MPPVAARSNAEAPAPTPLAVAPLAHATSPDATDIAGLKIRAWFNPDRPTNETDPTLAACARQVMSQVADFVRTAAPAIFLTIPDPFAAASSLAVRTSPPDDELPATSTNPPPRAVLPVKP
jgi:hypothetical protein